MFFRGRSFAAAALYGASAIAIIAAAPAYGQEEVRAFDIPAQPLSSALIEYGRQSGIGVAAASEVIGDRQSRAVRGRMTAREALDQLLDGTGLEVEANAQRGDREEIVFTATDRTRGQGQSLRIWNLGNDTVREVATSYGLLSGDRWGSMAACAASDAAAVCIAAEADRAPYVVKIDLETGDLTTLHSPNLALDDAQTVPPKFREWRSSDGERFTGVYFPARQRRTDERAPLFITYYSCPGYIRGGFGDEWPMAVLADAGIASVCVNQAQRNPDRSGRLVDIERAIEGITALIEMLHAEGEIDRDLVGIGGFSFGSEIALGIAADTDLLTVASVASSSVTPAAYWFRSLQPDFHERLFRTWQLGSPDETPEQWAQISPAYQTDRIRIPILFQLSEQEYLSPIEYFMRLRIAGVPADMYVFPNEPHVKIQPRHRLAIYQRNVDWFRFWLQGYRRPDSQDAAMFTRWEAWKEAFDHD